MTHSITHWTCFHYDICVTGSSGLFLNSVPDQLYGESFKIDYVGYCHCYASSPSHHLRFWPLPCPAPATDKVALLIGNLSYQNHPQLKAPMVDVYDLTNLLRQLNFKVVSLLDLTESEMRNAVDEFLLLLHKGVYGMFVLYTLYSNPSLDIVLGKRVLRALPSCRSAVLRRSWIWELRQQLHGASRCTQPVPLSQLSMCAEHP